METLRLRDGAEVQIRRVEPSHLAGAGQLDLEIELDGEESLRELMRTPRRAR